MLYFLFLSYPIIQLTVPPLINSNTIHRKTLLLSPVFGFFTADADVVVVESFFGVVAGVVVGATVDPVAGISTAARLYPQTVHSSCLAPFCVAFASLSTTHLKLCCAASALYPHSHSCQWLLSSAFQSESVWSAAGMITLVLSVISDVPCASSNHLSQPSQI